MDRPIPDLPGVEHRHIDVKGLRMHVAFAGAEDAEPLVLLHGWPQNWFAWNKLIGPLSQHYRVICPDLRGFGWSDAPQGSYEKSVLASDVIALLDELGLERVRLAGHDWGGFAGFLICVDAPERVSHYAAAGISHLWVKPEPGLSAKLDTARRLVYMGLIASPVAGKQTMQRVPGFVRTALRKSAVDPDATWTPETLAHYVDQWREPDRAAASVGIYRSFLTKELGRLARGGFRDQTMKAPCVLFVGTADPVIKADALGGFESNAPNLRLEIVENAGHWLPEEAPQALLEGMLALYRTDPPA
jgi:pimeloyl-ACP methyl ester carboxylesterase